MEDIIARLKQIIPSQTNRFPPLDKKDFFYFDKWAPDEQGRECLYYRSYDVLKSTYFHDVRRIPGDELSRAAEEVLVNGKLTKGRFAELCPVAQVAGESAFIVTGRCLQLLGLAKYHKRWCSFIRDKKHRR